MFWWVGVCCVWECGWCMWVYISSCCPSLVGTRGNKMIGCNVYDGEPRGDMCMVRQWVYSVAMVYGAAEVYAMGWYVL